VGRVGAVVRRQINKKKSLALPLNFLLGCSEKSFGSFELARLADVADLRGELHNILDRLIDQMSQAALAAWFRKTDREILKQALDNPDDVIALAKEQIRDGQRSEVTASNLRAVTADSLAVSYEYPYRCASRVCFSRPSASAL